MDLKLLLSNMFEGVYIVDQDRKILFWNKKAEQISGYTQEDMVGRHCYDNILRHVTISGKRLCHDGCPLAESLQTMEVKVASVFLHHKKGYRVPVIVKTIPFYDEEDKNYKAIEIFTDVMDEDSLYQENKNLKKAAIIDKLTQVYNRAFIDYQIETCIHEYHTFETPFAILFIDIDNFKKVNDTYGHIIGDNVLVNVAKTICLNIRSTDYIGRYGGEEFIVILRDVKNQDVFQVAEKIRLLVQETEIYFDNDIIKVTISIGCANYSPDNTMKDLVEIADKKLYEAKNSGKNKTSI